MDEIEAKKSLGSRLRSKFQIYEADRQPLEQQWLKNFRQFRGKYDPEIEKLIPPGRSRVYPLATQVKVLGFVAKIMELMFPANEKNWSLSPSPVPNINEQDVQAILDGLQQRAEQDGEEVTNADIESAVFRFAEDKARAMERECNDQITESGYTIMARKALRSGGVYGFGVTKGPLVKFQKTRSWEFNSELGRYNAVTANKPVPYYEAVKVWDIYPDLSAQDWWSQEGLFERIVFSRNDLYNLTKDGAFSAAAIKEFLVTTPEGNHKRRNHETELANVRHGDLARKDMDGRHYEVMRWFGFCSAKELRAAGVDVPENVDDEQDVLSDVWMLEDSVIRANVSPFGEYPHDMYHAFIAEDDEEVGITGIGMPEKLRDTQMKLCSLDRMTMDNAASVAGPIIEVNDDLLKKGQDADSIHAFKVIHREGTGVEAQSPAVRDIRVESHIPELINLRKDVVEQMDVESNLPSFLFGSTQGLGEAFRTTSNMSMMQGGAMMVTKDIIRSFDKWIESVIGSLYNWNMEFNTDEDIKGDFQVLARGTSSLVAKELRGLALDQFISTLDDDEKLLLKRREVLIDRLQARDLPVDRVVNIEEAEQLLADARAQRNAAAQAATMSEQARAAEREASTELKRVDADVKSSRAEAQNMESVARMMTEAQRAENDTQRAETDRNRSQTEAIGKLLDTIQKEQASNV